MIKDRSFEDNAEFFSTVFEIGRRHKILNPECMRTDYGKLVHMLMDSQNPDIQRLLEFKLVKKVILSNTPTLVLHIFYSTLSRY